VIQGSAKACVNFNGTGTVAIRASYNVSSITDNGTGDYTVNFTNAFADANYSVSSATGFQAGGSGVSVMRVTSINSATAPTASALRVSTSVSDGVNQDCAIVCVSIFR
jgi:hypothetical protein